MSRLTLPEPIDLVSAEEVRTTIARVDKELSELERRANDARTRADVQEGRAEELGVDGRASTWAMVRLQRFLDSLRNETERDIDEIRDVARARAAARIEEAEAEAARIAGRSATRDPEPRTASAGNGTGAAARVVYSSVPERNATPIAPMPPILPVVFDQAVTDVEPQGHTEPPQVVVEAPTPAVEPPVVETPVAEAPAVEPPVVEAPAVEAPVAEAPAVEPPVVIPPEATEIAGPEDPTETHGAPLADVVDPLAQADAAPAAEAHEFWPQQTGPKKKGFLRRIPVSAILEILAVILILIFILLRLS